MSGITQFACAAARACIRGGRRSRALAGLVHGMELR